MRPVNFGIAGTAFAALVAFGAGALPAIAEEPVETALKAWVAAIDLSPDWQASYADLTVDPVNGRATVTDFSVTAKKPGFAVKFGRFTVDGYRPTGDGTFAAREIDLDDARFDAGVYSIRIDHAALETPVLPMAAGFVWDDARPFVSAVKAIAPLALASAAGARVGSLTVVETLNGVETWSTYQQVKLEGLKGGKIALISAGPLRTDSPGADPANADPVPPPLVTLTAASAETRDIDLNAMLAIYDPDRYPGGVGDGMWRTTVGQTLYRNLGIDIPGIAVKIAGVAIDDFRMRQMKTPPDFGAAPAAASGKISDLVRGLDALAPYGIGRFALTDLDIASAGIDRMHLGKLTLADASTDSIGSFTAEGMEGGIGGQGLVKIGKLAFGGLVLPPFDAIAAAIDTQIAGGNVDASALVPTVGYVEAAGIDVGLTALPSMQLDHFRVDLGAYVDKVPTSIAVAVAGADVPASLIPDDHARRLLDGFGYTRVHVDGGAKIDWSPAGDIAIRDFSLGMKDVGAISGQADLTGLTPADAQHMAALTGGLDNLSLRGGTLAFKDDSIVGRGLTAQAERLNTDPVKFREQFAKGLPFMLMFLGDRALQAQLAPVLQTFIATPGTISATASPAAPVALSAIVAAATTAPFTLFGLLSVSVSGLAGPAPAN